MTVGARILKCQFKLLLTSKHSFFKGYPDAGADIGSFHRSISTRTGPPSAAKEIAEYITEYIGEIHAIKIKTGSARRSVKGCMTELIILSALLRIT